MSDVVDELLGMLPVKQPDPVDDLLGRSFFSEAKQQVSDFFTGEDRATRATRELPEALSLGVPTLLGPRSTAAQQAVVSLALNTTFDVGEMADIIEANTPDTVSRAFDEKGNLILQIGATGQEERVVQLNRPGVSMTDVRQGIATAAAFTPAGRGAALAVGAKSALTESAIQSGQKAAGGDFNTGEVALAGGAGALIQKLLSPLAKRIPALAAADDFEITPKVRSVIREEMVKLGFSLDELTDEVVDGLVDRVRTQVKPGQALAIQGEREFDIPLTAAQRSLDDAPLSFEDRARSGQLGQRAQRTIRDFELDEQIPAVNRAIDDVGRISQKEAGGVVAEGVRAAETAADDLVQQAYAEVGEATLDSDGVKRLLRATRRAVIGIDKDRNLKGTAGLLDAIKSQEKAQQLPGVRPSDLKQIELFRKRINTAIGAAENPSDKRQLTQMKRAFDDYLDDAVQKALFEGDEQALANLKEARGLFAEYSRKFRANPTKTKSGRTIQDAPGNFIEKIIESNPTDEQVVNTVFGASGFSSGAGARMAERYKEILGDEAWDAIRQAGFMRFVKTNSVNGQPIVSGTKSLKAIDDALSKNQSLMDVLYTPEEQSMFRRLFVQVKRTQPDMVRSRENPSGTAQALAKTITDVATRVGAFLGGDLSLVLTGSGLRATRGIRSATKAAQAVRPFQEIIRPSAALTGAGVAATQAGAEQ